MRSELMVRTLDGLHLIKQLAVVDLTVGAKVSTAMAVWAECDNKPRIVWATVRQSTNVVRLQVRRSVCAEKRCSVPASFTFSGSSCDHIVTNGFASFEYGDARHLRSRLRSSVKEGFPAKFSDVEPAQWLSVYTFNYPVQGPQFEHYGVTHVAISVWRAGNVVALTYKFSFEPKAFSNFSKQEQAVAVLRMASDRGVAALHSHVSDLSLAEILEDTIWPPSIRVPVCKTFIPRDDENYVVLSRSDDSALLLASEATVDVLPPIVDAPALKSPAQCPPSRFQTRQSNIVNIASSWRAAA